jgi:hypothetical protein
MILPSIEDLTVHITQNLELSLEKALGSAAAPLQAERTHRFLSKIAAAAASSGKPVPVAVVFSRTDINLVPQPYIGPLVPALLVKPDDSMQDIELPCALATLDEFAKTTSSDEKGIFLIYVRSSIGQSCYVSGRRIIVATYSEPCVFLHGTHHDLRAALEEYGRVVAKASDCAYLTRCWPRKGQYLLCKKPERHMRDSLWNFLRRRLSSHLVDREFTVKAKKPVDVVVDWKNAKRKAFVEIKWLGKSATTTTVYRPPRAVEGARQLRDNYVEPYLSEHHDLDLIGYLAVFDARKDRTKKIVYPSDVSSHQRIRLENDWETNPP